MYEVGEQGGTRFLAMGYIDGRPLSDYIKPGKLQPERHAALLVRKIALALEEAHRHGIVHRDLKPANVMINQRHEPIVMDFGLARRINDEQEPQLTQQGVVVGTPAYMAPEQVSGTRPLGPSSDIYSLGVILYELLTGERPFSGNVITVISQILHSAPRPIAEFRKDVSPAMVAICNKALAKKPEERHASMKEFAQELAGFLSGTTTLTSGMNSVHPAPATQTAENAGDDELVPVHAAPPAPLRRERVRKGRKKSASGPSAGVLIGIGGIGAALVMAVLLVNSPGNRTPQANAAKPMSSFAPPAPTPIAVAEPPASVPSQLPTAPPPVIEAVIADADPPSTVEPEPVGTEPVPAAVPAEPPPPTEEAAAVAEDPEPPLEEPLETPVTPAVGAEEHFQNLDTNRDKKLDQGELPLHIIFRADRNRDQKLTAREFEQAYEKRGEELLGPPTAEEERRLPRPPFGRGRPPGPPRGGPPPG